MASLKFIMDVEEESNLPDGDPAQNNKKGKVPSKPATTTTTTTTTAGQLLEEATSPQARPRYASSAGQVTEQDINPPPPSSQSKRRAASSSRSSHNNKSTATKQPNTTTTIPATGTTTTTGDTDNAPSPPLSPTKARPSARRRSTTSIDSMDRSGGYGSPASSSSIGGGLMRPMPSQPASDNVPMRLTPITGRVSRAKKGVPVHVCDICKPPKTFTRAEHLRRHQLSHGAPQYRCTGCEKAFHRPDLLLRHQQKNEHGDDNAVKSEAGQGSPRPSQTGATSRTQALQGSTTNSSTAIPNPGARPSPSPATTEGTATPSVGGRSQSGSAYTHIGSPAHGGNAYGTQGGAAADYSYTLAPTHSIINPTQTSALSGLYQPGLESYGQPRTAQVAPLQVVTQGLPLPSLHPPDFSEQRDVSPWPSSASDSTYSTPVSDISRHPRSWVRPSPHQPSQLLPPYPNPPPQRSLRSPGTGIDTMMVPATTSYMNSYTPTSSMQPTYGGVYDMQPLSFSGAGHLMGHPVSGLGNSHHHQQGNQITSARSLTPPPNSSARGNGVVATSHFAPSTRIDPVMNQKSMLMEAHRGAQSMMDNIGVIGDLGPYNQLGDISPGGDDGSHVEGLNLVVSSGMGGCLPMSTAMSIPLQAPIRAAIPKYLETYWSRIHPTLPVVHKQSFEAEPEDVLKCAMAAVATQCLDTKEDRNRGNQLHEYAWQEVKRAPRWTLPIKQTILLCEYFARFRGRKAVTRPSELFRSLYQRVSSLQLFTAPPSSSFVDGHGLWLFDTSAWSPISPSSSSSVSSCDSVTPTTTTVSPYVMRHLNPHPSSSWGSLSSSPYASSASSSFVNTPISSSEMTSLFFDFTKNSNLNVSSSPSRSREQNYWSSLFAPEHYNPAPAAVSDSFLFSTSLSQNPAQAYLQCVSDSQAMYHDPAMLDHAMLNSDQHLLSVHERWRNWVETESSRRLLAACFTCDGHTATYQQQRRVIDSDAGTLAMFRSIPLSGHSEKLWAASSAEEWAEVYNSNPQAATPQYAPEVEHITAEYIRNCSSADRMVILELCALRLPRRPRAPAMPVSADNSPAPDFDTHSQQQHMGGLQFDLSQQVQMQQQQQHRPEQIQNQFSLEAEERISALFGSCPIANTYLALHHTPLRDLLAVSGDSWVFSQKVLPAANFIEHTRRLKQWISGNNSGSSSSNAGAAASNLSGLSIARATMYASRAIVGFIDNRSSSSAPARLGDLSDYWALYVCTLICWAFGHGQRPRDQQHQQQGRPHRQRSSSGGRSGGSSPASRSSGLSSATTLTGVEDEALTWLRNVAADGTRPEEVLRLRGRREAAGVVGLVRRQLENDCVGGRNRLYVDAIGVLGRLEENSAKKWI
ncbi:hypothetical protein QBC35DRAFT_36200 [Podospora australis]|uniref:C2H2-type domain-containing protein n=1 Tax=Podospora australis TaxID=1536484 RepID=A0AAN6X0R2_9PEZI|nr:hypothetical protein QBC35DRAFT_36200 [Podospora australis]